MKKNYEIDQIRSDQSLSRVRLFATPWIPARQASLSITSSRSSLRLTSIESVMPSSHLILCHTLLLLPQSLPASESFPMSQLFTWGGQSTGVSALASFLPKNTRDWSPLEWTGWISLQSKGLSRVFSNTYFSNPTVTLLNSNLLLPAMIQICIDTDVLKNTIYILGLMIELWKLFLFKYMWNI